MLFEYARLWEDHTWDTCIISLPEGTSPQEALQIANLQETSDGLVQITMYAYGDEVQTEEADYE